VTKPSSSSLIGAAVVVAGAVLALGAATAHGRTGVSCPAVAAPAQLRLWPSGGTLRADVNGDGSVDSATIHYAPAAVLHCAFFLVVHSGGRDTAVRLGALETSSNGTLARQWVAPAPRLAAIVALGGRGAQVVVDVEEGASTVNVQLYGLRSGRVVALPVGRAGDISLYGSIGPGSTVVRCVRGGSMHVLTVRPTNINRIPWTHWTVSDRVYRLRGAHFVLTGSRTLRGSQAQTDARAARAGFNGRQFGGCTLARAATFR
jgi:hypothetical protein